MGIKEKLAGLGSGTADAASGGAGNVDWLNSGLDASAGAPAAPDAPAVDPATSNLIRNRDSATRTANINANQDRTSGTGSPLAAGGGATGAYEAGSDAGRANFDYMHDLGSNDFFTTGAGALNSLGEHVGVSHAGDAANPNPFAGGIANPLDYNPLSAPLDPNTGLGSNAGNAGRPAASLAPDAAAAASQGIVQTGAGAVGDVLDQVMGGPGDIPVDTSGNDRGGMGLNGAYSDNIRRAQGLGDESRALGQGVLDGSVAPGGAGAGGQQDALDQAMSFMNGPRKQNDVMTDVNGFLTAPGGPSAAELQLQQGAQGNMADALSLARSGRARDAGSQARMMSQALANNAATNVDTNRDTALLRAKETEARRGQDLSALGLKGNLAQGLDSDTLKALGLGGDLATQLRTGNITERGQSLSYDQGQNQIGAGYESDVLKTIPALEGIRHQDQFELTPQQKLAAAKLGGAPDKTTADYVTGLLGDVLPILPNLINGKDKKKEA